MRRYLMLSLLAGIFALCSCGPTVHVTPQLDEAKPHSFALLPIRTNDVVRDQRLQYLRAVVEAELRNDGYFLLDSTVVDRKCGATLCSEDALRPRDFGVDSILVLTIDSLSRTNFGLGYYNTIAGTLRMIGPQSMELARVEHRESERGGLIFQSGQIIQGIKESVENLGDDSFNHLAEKYARAVIGALPRVREGDSSAAPLQLATPQAQKRSPGIYEVCADGTPMQTVSLVVDRTKTNLRETTPGHYCGVYRLDAPSAQQQLAVELRSPFGDTVRNPLQLAITPPCDLSGAVSLVREQRANRLQLRCIRYSPTKDYSANCPQRDGVCEADKVLVYRSDSPYGPFEKVAELKENSWLDKQRGTSTETVYRIIPIDRDGSPATAVAVSSANR